MTETERAQYIETAQKAIDDQLRKEKYLTMENIYEALGLSDPRERIFVYSGFDGEGHLILEVWYFKKKCWRYFKDPTVDEIASFMSDYLCDWSSSKILGEALQWARKNEP